MPILKATHLSHSFDHRKIFDDVSFEIKKGERVALTGPSGVGKSTMALILAGHLQPQAGTVWVDGKDHTAKPSKSIFLIHQDDDLFPWLTVENQLRFVNPAVDLDYLLSVVKLDGEEKKYPFELSGGMKKRLTIARALALNPKVIILDEPFGSLDHKLKYELLSDLGSIWKNSSTSLVLVSHDPSEVNKLCQREIILTSYSF